MKSKIPVLVPEQAYLATIRAILGSNRDYYRPLLGHYLALIIAYN